MPRRPRAFVQVAAQICSKELQSIAMWNSITFSNADEKHVAWWVWFLLTFPFITYFTQTSTGGNKNLLSLHARSNFATLDTMLLRSFPCISLSILSSFPWEKEPCPNTLLADPFYAGICWRFLTSFNRRAEVMRINEVPLWFIRRGKAVEDPDGVLAVEETEVLVWDTGSDSGRVHREDHPGKLLSTGARGLVWAGCRWLCIHQFLLVCVL